MDRFGLTPEEYLVIELIFVSIEQNSNEPMLAYYKLPIEKTGLCEILTSLQNKGVVLKSCKFQKGKPFDRDLVQFNEIFLRNYRKGSGELGEEFFRTYPNEAVVQGQIVPLRNYAKKYKNEDDFYFNYGKAISWDPKKHREVLDLIKWSKEHDNFGLNMNIADFVGSKMWISIKDHKEGSNSVTFDTLTTI